MPHKHSKQQRKAARESLARAARTKPELTKLLREQLSFLELSAGAFDRGALGEAKRLALVIRVLVHDTAQSTSVLRQLALKDVLQFVDTAHPIKPGNLLPTEGLLMMRLGSVGSGYVAPLADGPPARYGKVKPFEQWWSAPVSKLRDGSTVSRKEYVLAAANREGGGHVDPALDPLFERFERQNPFGWVLHEGSGAPRPFSENAPLVAIRQIAFEVDQTLRAIPGLVHPIPNAP